MNILGVDSQLVMSFFAKFLYLKLFNIEVKPYMYLCDIY